MATRRTVPPTSISDKTISPAQGGPPSSSVVSDIKPAVPTDVIYKLLAFTFAMFVLPICSYFFTYRFIFNRNAIYAGGFAAVMANVVLIGYIVVAIREDSGTDAVSGATGVDALNYKAAAREKERSKKSE